MSVSPEPPERLAEILLEILALSDSTRTGQSKSARGNGPIDLSDVPCIQEQPRQEEEDNNRPRP
jgi:hypothetical protein